jgi:hypothetical protein
MTIVNDDSRVVSKLETSLTDDARVVIYDHHMFIVQATGRQLWHILPQRQRERKKSLMTSGPGGCSSASFGGRNFLLLRVQRRRRRPRTSLRSQESAGHGGWRNQHHSGE